MIPVKMVIILIASSLVSWCAATVSVKAPCPVIAPVANFNFTAFANGLWYQIARYPNNWEGQGDCATLEFKPEKDNTNFIITDTTDKKRVTIYGYLSPEVNNDSLVVFNSKTFNAAEGFEELYMHVLLTDNEKFLIGYECRYNEKTGFRNDHAWVGARTTKLDTHSQNIVDKFLKTSFVDKSKLIWDHFNKDLCGVKF